MAIGWGSRRVTGIVLALAVLCLAALIAFALARPAAWQAYGEVAGMAILVVGIVLVSNGYRLWTDLRRPKRRPGHLKPVRTDETLH